MQNPLKECIMRVLLGLFSVCALTLTASAVAEPSVAVVIDVRTPQEFSQGHVPGAVNIDIQSPEFEAKIKKLDTAKVYKVYCRSGNRSGKALQKMKSLGFKDVENLGSLSQALGKLNKPCEGNYC